MSAVLLINPNTSPATTAMMVAAARVLLPPGLALRGIGATRGTPMIVDEAALAQSEPEVVRIGLAEAVRAQAIIVAAFGDPGVASLRASLNIPVIGIGEAAIREAAGWGRRFGIATTTPKLRDAITSKVSCLLHGAAFTGIRIPAIDPLALAADPARQSAALHRAVSECIDQDGAETVIIGGGPLTDAAAELRRVFGDTIIEPISAAVRVLLRLSPPSSLVQKTECSISPSNPRFGSTA